MAYSVPESAGVRPAAASDTTLYTSTGAISALVTASNESTGTSAVKAWHRRGGAALDNTMVKFPDYQLLGNDFITIGPFFVATGGIITVRTSSTGVTFTMEGLSTA